MVNIQITPTGLFGIRWFMMTFVLSALCLMVSIVLVIVYASAKKQKVLSDGSIVYKRVNPSVLYFSLSFSVIALVGFILCTIQYLRIFHFSSDKSSLLFYTPVFFSLVTMSIDIYYLLEPSRCPDGHVYDDKRKQCVPDCVSGSRLDVNTMTCVPGCSTGEPCPGDIQCVSGKCCEKSTDIDCGGQCCSSLEECQEGKVCCTKDQYCNGKCCGSIGGCKDGQCVVYCPDKDYACHPGDACLSVDVSSDIYSDFFKTYSDAQVIDGRAYVCTKLSKNCQPDSTPQFIPNPVGNTSQFYPALGLPQGSTGENIINDALSNHDGGKKTDVLKSLQENNPNIGHYGAYCGNLSTPIRIISQRHYPGPDGGTCSVDACLDNAFPGITTNLAPVIDDQGQLWCNMILDDDYATSVSNSISLDKYNVVYYDDSTGHPVSETKSFKGVKSLSGKNDKNENPLSFDRDCSKFTNPECPTYGDSFVCNKSEDIGWFDVSTGLNFCTLDKGGGSPQCYMVDVADANKYQHYNSCITDPCPTTDINFNHDVVTDSNFQQYGTKGVCWTEGNYDNNCCSDEKDFLINTLRISSSDKSPCQYPGFVPILRIAPGWFGNGEVAYVDGFCCDPVLLNKNLKSVGKTIDDVTGSPDSSDDPDVVNALYSSCGPKAKDVLDGDGPMLGVRVGKKGGTSSCITDNCNNPGRSHCIGGMINTIKKINTMNYPYFDTK